MRIYMAHELMTSNKVVLTGLLSLLLLNKSITFFHLKLNIKIFVLRVCLFSPLPLGIPLILLQQIVPIYI